MPLAEELEANYTKFRRSYSKQAVANWKALSASNKYLESYRRIAALNSLKTDVLEGNISKDAISFFHEAHNDALQSHKNASVGSWRLALNSLRSFLENSLSCLYFMDHPVELRNWSKGKDKIWFSQLLKYFQAHPDIASSDLARLSLAVISEEYATLSKAVHGSSKKFRMTDDVSSILLWSTDIEKIGAWSTRELKVLSAASVIIVALFASRLTGTSNAGTRQALGYMFGASHRKKIKQRFMINVPAPF